MPNFLQKLPSFLIILAIKLYKWLISPLLILLIGTKFCRFQPSCSTYMRQAVEQHGAMRGVALGLRRLSRCHPWGGHGGDDPVPPASR